MFSKRVFNKPVILFALAVMLGCLSVTVRAVFAHPGHDHTKNLVDTAADQGQLAILVDLIAESGIEDTLRFRGPLTILAPTDDAFNEMQEAEFAKLLEDKKALEQMLRRHIIQGSLNLKALLDKKDIETVSGGRYPVVHGEKFTIGGATVRPGDIECTNGMLHVIHGVLPAQDSNEVSDHE